MKVAHPFHNRTNGHAALYAPETPSGASQPQPEDDLARVLSPTQVSTYLDCSAKWWYKHAMRLPERKSTNLGIGIAFHEAVMENFRQKVDTKEDLPTIGVRMLFRASWESMKGGLDFAPGENADDLAEMGEAVVEEYMSKVAPRIEPAAVEQPVSGMIGGVNVCGRIDVLDVEGRIIDAKTASKKPAGIAPNYRFQVATYAKLHRPGQRDRAAGHGHENKDDSGCRAVVLDCPVGFGPDRAHVSARPGSDAVWVLCAESKLGVVLAEVLLVLAELRR